MVFFTLSCILGIDTRSVIACEIDEAVSRTLLSSNLYMMSEDSVFIRDARQRDVHAMPKVDVFITSPPCVPFSTRGCRARLQHPQGDLMMESIQFIEAQRPPLVVFENVPGMMQDEDALRGLLTKSRA